METRIARMQELVRAVREVRNRYKIDPRTPLDVFVRCSEAVAERLPGADAVHHVAGRRGPTGVRPGRRPSRASRRRTSIPSSRSYVSLAGLIDVAAETRAGEATGGEAQASAGGRAKLDNANFVDKAPAEVVQQQRDLVADLQKQIRRSRRTCATCGRGKVESPPRVPIIPGDPIPWAPDHARAEISLPHVIEMNYQAGRRLGVNVYLIDGGSEFAAHRHRLSRHRRRDRRTDPPDGLQPVHLQDDHRHARRRRPHPGPGPRPRAAQDQGRPPIR